MALTDAQKQKVVTIDGLKTYHDQMVDTVIPGLIPETPSGTVPIDHGGTGATTAAGARSNLGLGNVGNFKAVSTVASQGLSDTEKSNARANIGAGTSSFSGSYNDLTNKPTIPTVNNGTFSIKTKVGSASAVTAADFTANQSGADDITLIQGSNVSLTTDATNRTITIAATNAVTSVAGKTGAVTLAKGDVGLGNVTNDSQVKRSEMGVANGVATLGSDGKVPSSQLPSYVDDVIEAYYKATDGKFYTTYSSGSYSGLITGETGKIYVDLSTNKTYRWGGSSYVVISETLALGETSSTAYRGDRGKTAYDHSQSTHARTDATAVAASSTNGNIKINGTETTVYTHPTKTAVAAAAKKVGYDSTGHVVLGDALSKSDVGLGNVANQTITVTSTSVSDGTNTFTKYTHPGSGTNPHGTTKSDVGLGNVGNFLAVSTESSQGLTDTQKSNARANIGLGSLATKSSLAASDIPSITKSKISDFPSLGTAAAKDVPSSGNASSTQVVMGNDSRLTNSRPASDVSSWAKASSKPSYAFSEITGTVANSQLDVASATDIAAIFS